MNKKKFGDNDFNFFTNGVLEDENFFQKSSDMFSYYQSNNLGRHLNGYDYNILQDDAYKNLKNELLKLEFHITKIEKDLESIDEQILIASEMKDYQTLDWLNQRRRTKINELEQASALYNQAGLSAKLSDGITNIVSPNFKKMKFLSKFWERIKQKLPLPYQKFFQLKKNLKKLEAIHKNVDELMTLGSPLNEGEERYEQISKYIAKANNIQSQLYKNIRNPK